MLFRAIQNEGRKLRRSMVWLAVFTLPVLSVLMGTFNYLQNIDILTNGWYSLWTQVTLFYCYFFFPCLLGIYASWLCRLEHFNHNWNTLRAAPLSYPSLFFSKLAAAGGLTLVTQLLLGLLTLAGGFLGGLRSPVPPELFAWMLRGWWGALAALAFQLFLSLRLRSFAAPVGVALAGGIGGLLLLSRGYGLCSPFSLISYGMCSVNPMEPFSGLDNLWFFCAGLLFLILFSSCGILYLNRSESL